MPFEESLPTQRVVFVHGFTQTGRSWAPITTQLAPIYQPIVIDLPGHGSAAAVRVPDVERAARFVGDTGGTATYVGYSMGGRICLRLALDHPQLVERLVLIGATPGIVDDAARAQRRAADETLAERLAPHDPRAASEGVDAFLDDWLAQPMFADLSMQTADRELARATDAEGLAFALRRLGTGTEAPCHDRLADLSMPVLTMAGANDEVFTAHAITIAQCIGANARATTIPAARHAAPWVQPRAFLDLVEDFLAET